MTPREVLLRLGVRGNRRIQLLREGDRLIVERYVHGLPRRKSWPNTKAGERQATLWMQHWYEAGDQPKAKGLTVRQLWERYRKSPAYAKLRPKTRINYDGRWDRFELFVKGGTLADQVSIEMLDDLWTTLLEQIAPNQARGVFTTAKLVYRWGLSRELVTSSRVVLYKLPTGAQFRALKIPEYTPEEAERILATGEPQRGTAWRFGTLWQFLMAHGFRFNAAVHLRWEDVDWERATVRMVEAFDKTHKEMIRPLTWGSYAALLTARYWRERLGYTGPWVFFSAQPARRDEPWSYQAANLALRRAEDRAGVPHIKFRAFHGERREVSGTLRELTGDAALALQIVGDDVRQASSYLKEREAEIADAMGRLNR